MRKPTSIIIRLASVSVFAGSLLVAISSVSAQTSTWTGISGNWSDTTDPGGVWVGGVPASGADNTANFTGVNITANQTITLDADRTIGNITFTDATASSHNLTISGANILTLDVTTGIPIIDVTQSGRLLTISSEITGNDGLQKNGAGTLVLSVANSYTGGTTLNGGVVQISNATSLSSGLVSVIANSRINAAALTYTNAIDIDATRVLTLATTGVANSTSTFSGAITGAGSITLGQGVTSGTTVNLSSTSNTFTGDITLPTAAGTNDFINFASIGDGGSIIFGRASWLANVRYTGAADLEFNTRNIELATTFGITSGLDGSGNPSHMFANNGAGTVTFNTAMGVTTTATSGFFFLGGNNTGNNTFAGAIADPTGATTLGIGKAGTGKWILSNNTNSFEGDVFIYDGTLSVSNIDLAANAQSLGMGSLIRMGYRTANVGTLEYTGAANASTDKQIVVGFLPNANNGNFRGGGVILNNGDGTLTFSNPTFNSTVGVPVTGTGHVRNLTLGGTNTGDNTISGTIQNNNTLIGAIVEITKTGAGTWVLDGANTYTGATTVSQGMLVINGDQTAATGTTTVASLATLGGNGTIGGALVANGSIAPGNSIGTLNVNNNVTWNGSAGNEWVFELGGGNTADLLDITGNFNKGTGSLFEFDFAGSTATGNFTLVEWDGTTSFDVSDFSYTNLGGGNTGNFTLTATQLQFVVVPEPTTMLLFGAGATLLGLHFARRRS
jgi:fibronectin-binding autotransporter adhesin